MSYDIIYYLILFLISLSVILELDEKYYMLGIFYGSFQLVLTFLCKDIIISMFDSINGDFIFMLVLMFSIFILLLSIAKFERGLRKK